MSLYELTNEYSMEALIRRTFKIGHVNIGKPIQSQRPCFESWCDDHYCKRNHTSHNFQSYANIGRTRF